MEKPQGPGEASQHRLPKIIVFFSYRILPSLPATNDMFTNSSHRKAMLGINIRFCSTGLKPTQRDSEKSY